MTASLLALALMVLWAAGCGRELRLLLRVRQGPCGVALDLLAGLLLFYLLLLARDALGIALHRAGLLVLGIAVLGALALARRRLVGPAARSVSLRARAGWGDALAVLAVLLFAAAAVTLRSDTPDFVYHWGLKGRHYFEHRGIDWNFLERDEVAYAHPDYPHLLPLLFAAQSLLAGQWSEPALQLWPAVFLALLFWVVRETLATLLPGGHIAQAGIAAMTCAVAAFSIGHGQSGGPDLAFALALLVGGVLIQGVDPLGAVDTSDAAAGPAAGPALFAGVGLVAAFAAALKIEGLPLAASLLALSLLGHRRRLLADWRCLAWLVVPALAVIVPWWLRVQRHGLFLETNTGAPDLGRLRPLAAGVLDVVRLPEWHSLPWLFVLLPLVLVLRGTRLLGLVVALQLFFDAAVYLTAPVDTYFYVVASLPRLLLQVLPALLVGLLVALSRGLSEKHAAAARPLAPSAGRDRITDHGR